MGRLYFLVEINPSKNRETNIQRINQEGRPPYIKQPKPDPLCHTLVRK